MNSLEDFLSGRRVLGEYDSPINGKITVVRDFAWGTHVNCGNITQSGGVVESVWKDTLSKYAKVINKNPKNILILGLGGGTTVKLLKKYYSKSKIDAVEIDPIMAEIAQKHFDINKYKPNIIISDGYDFVQNTKNKYDLVLVDTYIGTEFPQKLASESFIKNIKKILSKNGFAIFNRLYYADKRKAALEMERLLENEFQDVHRVLPEANIMFICQVGA